MKGKNDPTKMPRKVAVKRMKNTMGSLCDDDSSSAEESRVPFNPIATISRKTGINDIINESKSDKDSSRKLPLKYSSSSDSDENDEAKKKRLLGKEYSESDKQKSAIKNKKAYSNSTRKQSHKSRELKCSDLEDKKHSERSQRFLTLPTNKEEADSSSGKEFQKSKLSRNTDLVKKICEAKRNKEPLDPSFTKYTGEKTLISKKQSLRFKSHVIKSLNKFKDVCSEYELRMEHVKWKYFRKELIYQESANDIVEMSRSLILKLKAQLDVQEKQLMNFYKEWSESCMMQDTDQEDSSSSESEVLRDKNKKETSNKTRANSKEGSIVSECDNKEIFSDHETAVRNIMEEKDEENDTLILDEMSEKSIDDNDDDNGNTSRAVSPILGSKTEKEIPNKTQTKGTWKTVDSNEQVSKERHGNENEKNIDESVDDIFDECTIRNASTPQRSESNKDEVTASNELPLRNDNNSESEETVIVAAESDDLKTDGKESSTDKEKTTTPTASGDSKQIPEPSVENDETIEKDKVEDNEENNLLSELNEEVRAERLPIDSDQETVLLNEECRTKSSVRESQNSNLTKKDRSKCKETITLDSDKKKESNKTPDKFSCHDSSSDGQTEFNNRTDDCAKRDLLDSHSDDSSDDRKTNDDENQEESDNSDDVRAKAKLLISSNTDSSGLSSDSDSERDTESMIVDTCSNKSNEKAKALLDTDIDSSVGERVKKRRSCLHKRGGLDSDQKLNMVCRVVLERLPANVLEKHANALERSRRYLEGKRIKSLIDIDRLQKDNGRNSPTRRNSSKKKLATKIMEDSLLDHLDKVKNGDLVENPEKDPNSECSSEILQAQTTIQSINDLMLEADRATKNMLLNSSDSEDIEERKTVLENGDGEQEEGNAESKDRSKEVPRKKKSDEDEDEQETAKWRRNKVLTMKLSSGSDSDAKREKWNNGQEKLREVKEEIRMEDSDIEDAKVKCKKRKSCRKIMDSDSDTLVVVSSDSSLDASAILEDGSSSSSDSSSKKNIKSRKRKTRKSSDTDNSYTEKRSKPKRKRIKNVSSDSEDAADDKDEVTSSQGTPGKMSRKNIRKVMKDKQVADDTKQAAKEEEERLKRIAERQKLYNEMYEVRLANEEKVDKLVLDFDPETKEELLIVHESLVKRLKPHQAKGVKFMWDACFESIERMKNSPGSGCIIAHCMGLGKTLQVIALTHTLLTHENLGVKTIMIVCPLNIVLNWRNEFNLWLKDIDHDIEVYELTRLKQNTERRYMLERWQNTGGVLIIGYEMFRNLSGTNNRMQKNTKESVLQCLINPGPDIVVCDEGHLLKNEDTALSKCMNRIKTLRRIVLTGTPLQNNLIEYHCMVQFIKPNLLGTKREFLNRFANPITNGQFDDSTEYDVKLMKKRAYVLHKMLKGCVQRFDYSVLMPFLPPKQEYVIFVSLTEVQINLYRYYLENFARKKRSGGGFLFADFQSLQRIWTHPLVLRLNAEKIDKMNEKKFSSDSEGSLRNFIDDGSDATTTSTSSVSEEDDDVVALDSNVPKKLTRRNKPDVEVNEKPEEPEQKEESWWSQFVQPEHFEDIRISSKLLLLFGILKECEQIGDKILVFSQSLYSLTLIERFLQKIDDETQNGTNSEYIDGHVGSWSLGLDYFRLDGQTSAENRNIWCKIFNQPTNTRARLFLISTRAGGLGINLTAANRVIIFDASWNPSHDVQSIFRVYRFGQKKPCYVYRFLAAGTMEEKIYNRQVTKLSLSCRVVDVQQIERHYSNNDLTELYKFEPSTNNGEKTLNLPKDRLLREIFLKYKQYVENYHEHDSLLENKAEEELNEEERKQAWLEYEEEKKGKPLLPPSAMAIVQNNAATLNQQNLSSGPIHFATDYEQIQEFIRKDYPNATPEYQQMMTARVLTDMYNYWEQQTYNSANKLINQQNAATKASPFRGQQMLNVPQTSYGLHNTNTKPTNTDNDDVIEILPSTTSTTTTTTVTSKTNKSKEE